VKSWLLQTAPNACNLTMMNTREKLLAEIDAFLADTGMSPTTFGAEATGDRALMITLRKGRDPKSATVDKIRAYIARHSKARRKPRPKAAHERAAA